MNEQTLEVATIPQQAITRVQDNAMGVADILAQVRLIQEVMGKVMQEGVHFGKVPGCGDRMTLLQPGAQKLTMTFRLAPEYQIQETNYDRGHKEYRVICTLKSIASGNFVGQGVGCCSTLESKYRWRGGARKCPQCGKETIIKGKAEFGGGWLCFGKKGGCGHKWPDGSAEIEGQSVDKVENESPADAYNTVLKMAKKRAFVDATITATASSDFLTQDIGDDEGDETPEQPPKTPQDEPRTPPSRASGQGKKAAAAPQGASASKAPVKNGTNAKFDVSAFLTNCKNRLLALVSHDDEWAWWKYGQDRSWILPNESLADAAADKMFEGYDTSDIRNSVALTFDAHCTAVKAMAANCPKEMHEEILRGFVPMPAAKEPDMLAGKKAQPAGNKQTTTTPKAGCCPACNSTAVKTHEDLVGVMWCQKCGTQWQDINPTQAYEEHDWMFAKLPFAPKDASKPYKGMTLGQISRLDSKYWFGIVMNFKAEPFRGRPPSAESVKFGEACEAARKHLGEPEDDYEGKDDELPM